MKSTNEIYIYVYRCLASINLAENDDFNKSLYRKPIDFTQSIKNTKSLNQKLEIKTQERWSVDAWFCKRDLKGTKAIAGVREARCFEREAERNIGEARFFLWTVRDTVYIYINTCERLRLEL